MKQLLIIFALSISGISTLIANPGKANRFAPTKPAINLNFTGIDGNRIHIHWQNGDGSRRIVVARKTTMVTAVPVNGMEYKANEKFGAGSEIAKDEYVIYNGEANNVSVSGLTANSSYYFAVFEYNGTSSTTEYISTALTGNQATLAAPSFPPVGISISNINDHSMTLNWKEDLLTGSGRIVLVKAGSAVDASPVDLQDYIANRSFAAGSQIGSGNYVVYDGNAGSVTIDNLKPNTVYHVALFEYNGSNGKVYNVSKPIRIHAGNSVMQATKVTVSKK